MQPQDFIKLKLKKYDNVRIVVEGLYIPIDNISYDFKIARDRCHAVNLPIFTATQELVKSIEIVKTIPKINDIITCSNNSSCCLKYILKNPSAGPKGIFVCWLDPNDYLFEKEQFIIRSELDNSFPNINWDAVFI